MSEVRVVEFPLYNTSDPTLWFIMCEITFTLATPKPITESVTKYNYIVANLPPDTASLVRDILMRPDVTDPYAQVRNELINRSGEGKESAGGSETFFEGTIRFSKNFRIAA
ncbi:transposon Ty3-G Gag-Pol polyprotein [Trichonephila clavipes]|nr:transposon Ty3-G Gag-Pol polyprotein [Trichonephila clavipes]